MKIDLYVLGMMSIRNHSRHCEVRSNLKAIGDTYCLVGLLRTSQ